MVERSDYHAERDRLSGIPLRGVEHLSRVTMLSLKVDIIVGVFLSLKVDIIVVRIYAYLLVLFNFFLIWKLNQ